MKYFVLSILALAAPMSFAATANDFVGHYSLESETALGKKQQQICSPSLDLLINGKNIHVVTDTFDATAEINGPAVTLADSTREGDLTVGFANDQLTVSIHGILPAYLAPNAVEFNEVITLEQMASAGKLSVRHVFSSAVPAFNANSHCVYNKN